MNDAQHIIIHDLPDRISDNLLKHCSPDTIIFNANQQAARCIGCFRCWLKTPGVCTFSDSLQQVGQLVLSAAQVTIITQMLYGGVSVPVKRVLDRCIPGVTPFFCFKKGLLHHLQRYPNESSMNIIFYNAQQLSKREKQHGAAYAAAMGTNFYAKHQNVLFVNGTDFSEVLI